MDRVEILIAASVVLLLLLLGPFSFLLALPLYAWATFSGGR
jgi:hypothetical protein